MSSKLISASVLAIAALASASSFAADSTNFFTQPAAQSVKSRDEVKAETAQAMRQGYVATTRNQNYPANVQAAQSPSQLTRADVRASAAVDSHIYR